MIAFITFVGAIVAAIAAGIYTSLQSDIQNRRHEPWIRLVDDPPLHHYYRVFLRFGLRRLNEHIGAPFTNKSLAFNTNLAVFYSFAAFFLIWVFTGSGKAGNYEILDERLPPGWRFVCLLLSSGLLWFTIRSLRTPPASYATFRRRLHYLGRAVVFMPAFAIAITVPQEWLYDTRPPKLLETILIMGLASTLSGAILSQACTKDGIQKGNGAVVFAVTFIVLVCGAVGTSAILQHRVLPIMVTAAAVLALPASLLLVWLITTRVGGSWVYLLNIVLVIATIVGKTQYPTLLGIDDVSSSLLYFFVLLPNANGLLDWMALSSSRVLAARNVSASTLSTMLFHLFFDVVAAFALLALLVVTLVIGTTFYNWLLVRDPTFAIPVGDLIESTRAHPLGRDGLWVTVMLFSTLVPTLAHMAIAIAGVMFKFPFRYVQSWLARSLRRPVVSPLSALLFTIYIVTVDVMSVVATLVVFIALLRTVQPYLTDFLYDVALRARAMVPG